MPELGAARMLVALALLLAAAALWQALAWTRNRGHPRGTPQYARARDGRRYALVLALLAIVAFSLANSWRLFAAVAGVDG